MESISFWDVLRREPAGRGMWVGVQREITARRFWGRREEGQVMRKRVEKGVEGCKVEGGEVVRCRV